jgi:transcriptional regulator with XRE-family HTH domain
MQFREYINEKLKKKGISINKLSEELRIREGYLRDVLAGRRVSLPTIHKISEYLNDPYLVYLYVSEKLQEKNFKKEVEEHDKV